MSDMEVESAIVAQLLEPPDAGPPGPEGKRGPTGLRGPRGEKGDAGGIGAGGATGRPGPRGEGGEAGPKGDAGRDGIGPDERVRAGSDDATAGYLGEKLAAGIGIKLRRRSDPKKGDVLIIDNVGSAGFSLGGGGAGAGAGEPGPAGPPGAPGADGEDGAPGAPGAPGDDGPSAYQVAVTNGFLGTEAEWLASLVGPEGPQGDPGLQGEDGPMGPQGDPGTPGAPGTTLHAELTDTDTDGHPATTIAVTPAGGIAATNAQAAFEELDAEKAPVHGHPYEAAGAVATHAADTTDVHGIVDTATLYRAGGTEVALADGGTGASDAAGARTALGLVIGTDVAGQAAFADHSARHENGGADEISVASLSGELADPQPPKTHASSHGAGGADAIKLDDLAAPDDNTDLNASLTAHGLLPKLPGGTTTFLRADGAFAAAGGAGADPYLGSYAPGSFTIPTAKYAVMGNQLELTGAQMATIEGTGHLIITGVTV